MNQISNSILSDLISLSGIFAGLISGFITVQVFKLKSDREHILEQIRDLSKKLTNYKRIIYYIKSNKAFWKTFDDINNLKKKYKGITFHEIHSAIQSDTKGMSYTFWLDKQDMNTGKADLYLAMIALLDNNENIPSWTSDKRAILKFEPSILESYIEPANQIWYYLDYKFAKHVEGEINPDGITGYWFNQIIETLPQIDPKFKRREFDRILIAEISSDFSEYYIPKLIKLTKSIRSKLPVTIKVLLYNLVFILAIGVIFPLVIKLFVANNTLINLLTNIAGIGILVCFIVFIISFIVTIGKEVKIFK